MLSESAKKDTPLEIVAEEENQDFSNQEFEKIDEKDFQKVWEDLMKHLEKEGKEGNSLVTSAMRERKPILDQHIISMLVENKSQEEEVIVFRADMHEFIREKLNHPKLTIEVTINRDESDRKGLYRC